MEGINPEEDIRIDVEALDAECVKLPTLLQKYSDYLTYIEGELESLKDDLETAQNKLSIQIRNDPKEFGLDRITDKAITERTYTHVDVKELRKKVLEAKKKHSQFKGYINCLHRKDAQLKNLVLLHGQNYFVGPSSPTTLSENTNQHDKNKTSRVKTRLAQSARSRAKNQTLKQEQ